MTLQLLLETILLGLVEGITEFLPVSSTGHLILVDDLLGFSGPPGKVFEIVIQLGAILAVCFLYRAKIWSTITGVLKREPVALRFAGAVIVAWSALGWALATWVRLRFGRGMFGERYLDDVVDAYR